MSFLEITDQHPIVLELPYDLAILLLDIYTRELKTHVHKLYTNVHSIIIHNSQKVTTTQMFPRMDKQNVGHPYLENTLRERSQLRKAVCV